MHLRLTVGTKVVCTKDKWTKYDLGATGWTDDGIAFHEGQVTEVVESTPSRSYVLDTEDNCLHVVTDEYFKPIEV